jgi:hypothetical protein
MQKQFLLILDRHSTAEIIGRPANLIEAAKMEAEHAATIPGPKYFFARNEGAPDGGPIINTARYVAHDGTHLVYRCVMIDTPSPGELAFTNFISQDGPLTPDEIEEKKKLKEIADGITFTGDLARARRSQAQAQARTEARRRHNEWKLSDQYFDAASPSMERAATATHAALKCVQYSRAGQSLTGDTAFEDRCNAHRHAETLLETALAIIKQANDAIKDILDTPDAR